MRRSTLTSPSPQRLPKYSGKIALKESHTVPWTKKLDEGFYLGLPLLLHNIFLSYTFHQQFQTYSIEYFKLETGSDQITKESINDVIRDVLSWTEFSNFKYLFESYLFLFSSNIPNIVLAYYIHARDVATEFCTKQLKESNSELKITETCAFLDKSEVFALFDDILTSFYENKNKNNCHNDHENEKSNQNVFSSEILKSFRSLSNESFLLKLNSELFTISMDEFLYLLAVNLMECIQRSSEGASNNSFSSIPNSNERSSPKKQVSSSVFDIEAELSTFHETDLNKLQGMLLFTRHQLQVEMENCQKAESRMWKLEDELTHANEKLCSSNAAALCESQVAQRGLQMELETERRRRQKVESELENLSMSLDNLRITHEKEIATLSEKISLLYKEVTSSRLSQAAAEDLVNGLQENINQGKRKEQEQSQYIDKYRRDISELTRESVELRSNLRNIRDELSQVRTQLTEETAEKQVILDLLEKEEQKNKANMLISNSKFKTTAGMFIEKAREAAREKQRQRMDEESQARIKAETERELLREEVTLLKENSLKEKIEREEGQHLVNHINKISDEIITNFRGKGRGNRSTTMISIDTCIEMITSVVDRQRRMANDEAAKERLRRNTKEKNAASATTGSTKKGGYGPGFISYKDAPPSPISTTPKKRGLTADQLSAYGLTPPSSSSPLSVEDDQRSSMSESTIGREMRRYRDTAKEEILVELETEKRMNASLHTQIQGLQITINRHHTARLSAELCLKKSLKEKSYAVIKSEMFRQERDAALEGVRSQSIKTKTNVMSADVRKHLDDYKINLGWMLDYIKSEEKICSGFSLLTNVITNDEFHTKRDLNEMKINNEITIVQTMINNLLLKINVEKENPLHNNEARKIFEGFVCIASKWDSSCRLFLNWLSEDMTYRSACSASYRAAAHHLLHHRQLRRRLVKQVESNMITVEESHMRQVTILNDAQAIIFDGRIECQRYLAEQRQALNDKTIAEATVTELQAQLQQYEKQIKSFEAKLEDALLTNESASKYTLAETDKQVIALLAELRLEKESHDDSRDLLSKTLTKGSPMKGGRSPMRESPMKSNRR